METLKIGIKNSEIYSIPNFLIEMRFSNLPLEFLFSREEYIVEHVEDGLVDVGIVQESTFLETKKSVDMIKRLVYEINVILVDRSYPVDNLFHPEDPIEIMIANKFLSKEKKDILEKLLIKISELLLEQFFSEFPEVSH